MTSDISTYLPRSKDMTTDINCREEHRQIPTQTPRHDRYIRQDKSSSSPSQNYLQDQNMRDGKTTVQPKLSGLAKDTFSYEIHDDLRVDIHVSEYISDRLYRTVQFIRKPKYNRNNSQSDVSDYAPSTQSSVRIPDQIANLSCGHITCMQPCTRSRIHLVGKSQKGNIMIL